MRSHLVNLNKLRANTVYRYRITAFAANGDSFSTDPRGTNQWSFDWQLRTSTAGDTLAPLIIEGPEVIARDKIAVLEWVTDVETSGKVFFGTRGGTYGTSDEFSISDLAPDGSPSFSHYHIVTLAGLDPGTNYQFRIESTGANGKKVVFTPSAAAAKRAGAQQPSLQSSIVDVASQHARLDLFVRCHRSWPRRHSSRRCSAFPMMLFFVEVIASDRSSAAASE